MNHYVYWLRGEQFCDFAKLSMDSVRNVDGKACFHVWTDAPEETPPIVAGDVTWNIHEPGRPPMVANLDAQIAALNSLDRGSNVLFLDADILMRRRFPWGTPDLYVTWRERVTYLEDNEVKEANPEMVALQPYNYGVMGARVSPKIIETFYWLRARILQMNIRNQMWFGNQLALADLCGGSAGPEDKRVHVNWSLSDTGTELLVRRLPCSVWNYSPNSIDEDVSERAVLHLKGERKDLMEHFARAA